ncbi:HAD family hydrolase [Paracidovorax wautersii]|uniref:HAD superfamily hydrolase (TIGR01509 family) n=1 Tax=Paracidovorax wautersii TaxID=1177982 RepID=A0ABU1IFH7_9BURK|nr:HAD family hydrolase [Paracidovorax wautersii]MDR6215019.1 HAD superfamily hydrolase (TIGR01509 family) [Paracidovorax wautersii]
MLDISRIRAITIDLDDTLWPIWPTIARAEKVLIEWLLAVAPGASALLASPDTARMLRAQVAAQNTHRAHDLTVLRRETIRAALRQAGEDEALTDQGFDVFFAERQRVELYEDALATLEFLSSRHPVVALSNGNANLQLIGIDRYFRGSISAKDFGIAKPDPRIFHEAARVLAVDPAAVLHVGDDATLDAHGALGAGMQAVWLNRGEAAWPHEHPPHATVPDLGALCRLLG